MKDGDNILY